MSPNRKLRNGQGKKRPQNTIIVLPEYPRTQTWVLTSFYYHPRHTRKRICQSVRQLFHAVRHCYGHHPRLSLAKGVPIRFFSSREVARELDQLNPKKALGAEEVTVNMFKELLRKGTVMLTYICNGVLRLNHVSKMWKTAKIIMVLKPQKPVNSATS